MNRIVRTVSLTLATVALATGLAAGSASAAPADPSLASAPTAGRTQAITLYCGPYYVPYQHINGSYVGYLASRSMCGPKKAFYDIRLPGEIPIVWRAAFLRCVAFNTNPAISGNAFAALARYAWNVYQAGRFCENHAWWYVYVY